MNEKRYVEKERLDMFVLETKEFWKKGGAERLTHAWHILGEMLMDCGFTRDEKCRLRDILTDVYGYCHDFPDEKLYELLRVLDIEVRT